MPKIKSSGNLLAVFLCAIGVFLVVFGTVAETTGFPLSAVTVTTKVVDKETKQPIAGAYVYVSSSFYGGGTIPNTGYTDAIGEVVIELRGGSGVLGWSVSKDGYITQVGSGNLPAIIELERSQGGSGGGENGGSNESNGSEGESGAQTGFPLNLFQICGLELILIGGMVFLVSNRKRR